MMQATLVELTIVDVFVNFALPQERDDDSPL